MAGMQLTKSDLARCMGVSLPTISHWIRAGCPYVEKGSKSKQWVFDTSEVIAWREERAAQAAVGDTKGLDIDEARRRKVAAEAALVELDLSKRRGEVVEIDAVADAVGDDYANVRAKLLSMPSKLAPMLVGVEDPAEIKALLEKGVSEALEELAADGIYQSTESSDTQAEGSEPKAAA